MNVCCKSGNKRLYVRNLTIYRFLESLNFFFYPCRLIIITLLESRNLNLKVFIVVVFQSPALIFVFICEQSDFSVKGILPFCKFIVNPVTAGLKVAVKAFLKALKLVRHASECSLLKFFDSSFYYVKITFKLIRILLKGFGKLFVALLLFFRKLIKYLKYFSAHFIVGSLKVLFKGINIAASCFNLGKPVFNVFLVCRKLFIYAGKGKVLLLFAGCLNFSGRFCKHF